MHNSRHMLHFGLTSLGKYRALNSPDLPTAEYNLVANCTIAQALEKAQRAAQKTRKRFAAVVSEYTSCHWAGLEQVRRAPARAY